MKDREDLRRISLNCIRLLMVSYVVLGSQLASAQCAPWITVASSGNGSPIALEELSTVLHSRAAASANPLLLVFIVGLDEQREKFGHDLISSLEEASEAGVAVQINVDFHGREKAAIEQRLKHGGLSRWTILSDTARASYDASTRLDVHIAPRYHVIGLLSVRLGELDCRSDIQATVYPCAGSGVP